MPSISRRESPSSRFPIVGVGASAGGLEAFEQFLAHVPKKCGMAFVLVQHLDPTRKGILVEILARRTPMPVIEATEGMRIERETVYVIPPNKELSLAGGALHLKPLDRGRGAQMPIDLFFRSLAKDLEQRSIGVILSGMGSDGTLGLRAIKEGAGAGFVQSVESAKFDGMPRSAIDSGMADVVAPAEELPALIAAYLKHAQHVVPHEPAVEERAESDLRKICVLLRAQSGNDFSLYKGSTILRRIERRMGLHQIGSTSDYVRYLRENPREVELLFKELLIGVTSFFRDPPLWDRLKQEALPALVAQRGSGGMLRAWVPGCSTGEEAFSLAMVFRELTESLPPPKPMLQVFATDLDRDAIERARHGHHPHNIAVDVSAERLKRWFVQDEHGYRVGKEIREMVVFATQNLIVDPPFTKLDILSCRNLLIYLSAELQRKLIPLFHYSLNREGVLCLGSAETVGPFTNLFSSIDGPSRVYRKIDYPGGQANIEFPSPIAQVLAERPPEPMTAPRPAPNLQAVTDRLLAQQYAPVGILCSERGDILYLSGRTGKYLEPAVGKAELNIFAMAREGLRHELSNAFAVALRGARPVTVSAVKVIAEGPPLLVDVTVQKLVEPRELRGSVLVVLADAPHAAPATPPPSSGQKGAAPRRVVELEGALVKAHDELERARGDMQTSQEELRSTNEELQSTNEELQSTNEELTTSKEELQSLNEELQTLNHELQSKVDDLSRSNNDMKNLLNSTDIATLFLDSELRVRRFTTQTARIIKLIASDAGRPITDITMDLHYPALEADAREVLRTLVFKEAQVTTKDGRWFAVRILPYRTVDNVIDGVVITFTDVSASRALELALREQASQMKQLAESLPNLVWGFRADGPCDYLGPQWVAYTGVPADEQLGYRWLEQLHEDDRDRVREAWRVAVKGATPFDTELRIRGADGVFRWFKAGAVALRDSQRRVTRWYGTATDIDGIKHDNGKRPAGVRRRKT